MEKRTRVDATWESYGDAVRLFARGVTVRTASQIALVVGTWLSLMNQGRAIAEGNAPWVKIALNYLTPFVVASLGFLAARRRRNVERLAALLYDDPDGSGAVRWREPPTSAAGATGVRSRRAKEGEMPWRGR